MESKQVIRLLPNGKRELILAKELGVGDHFIDDLKREVVVQEVSEDMVICRVPNTKITVDISWTEK